MLGLRERFAIIQLVAGVSTLELAEISP